MHNDLSFLGNTSKWKPLSRMAKQLMVREAFDITKKGVGQIPFKHSSISDPHIREIIERASIKTGIPVDLLDKKVSDAVNRIESLKKYSFLMYDTISKNAVENAVFELATHAEGTPGFDIKRDVLSMPIFFKLVKLVQLENSSFFPLRAPNEHTYIYNINPIIVPNTDPKFKKFNSIPTAAVTEHGDFIFNAPFMQQLLDYAVIEKLKPIGKKYQCNGGKIPDSYGYIEFVIMHELLHYAYGDVVPDDRLPQYSHIVKNYAADFRINYMLVKAGYTQLPIGFFSDHINYDRQKTYDAMVKLVHDEMQKLPKEEKETVEQFGKLDDHIGEGKPGEGKPGEGKPGEGKPSEGKPGEGQDDVNADIQDKLNNRSETDADGNLIEPTPTAPSNSLPRQQGGDPGTAALGVLTSRESEIIKIKPRLPWRQLLRKMVTSATPLIYTSYSKPARRSITGISVAARTGASAIKPGERTLEEAALKIVLVLDTSGSMYDTIPTVLAECQKLVSMLGKSSAPIGVVFFAGSDEWFKISLRNNTYSKVSNAKDLSDPKIKPTSKNWKTVLSHGGTGGTIFSSNLSTELSSLCAQGWNVMIFSDEDVLDGSNWQNVYKKLYQTYKSNVFLVLNTIGTFRSACSRVNQVPPNWTHL